MGCRFLWDSGVSIKNSKGSPQTLLFVGCIASGLHLLKIMGSHLCTKSPEAWSVFPKRGTLLIDIFFSMLCVLFFFPLTPLPSVSVPCLAHTHSIHCTKHERELERQVGNG